MTENMIRFITPQYKTLFWIEDGGMVKVTAPDREFEAVCRYLDPYHVSINGICFHICQYAEKIAGIGGTVFPVTKAFFD